MYIHGEFINKVGDIIAVHIVTQNSKEKEKVIGNDERSEFFFPAEDAVTIDSEFNDTFDVLLTRSATITLQASYYEPSLYGSTCRDGIVNILRNGKVIFAGYIEPLSYSQNYNESYDDVSIACVDCLSALQYSNYRNVGASGISYDKIKAEADQRTFYDLFQEMIDNISMNINIVDEAKASVYYDGSKSLDKLSDNQYKILSQVSISELLFLEDEEDDVWTQDAVMESLLKYLDLHITQIGLDFYLFSWSTLRSGGETKWIDIFDSAPAMKTTSNTIDIVPDIVADCDAQMEISEVYNQLQLTDNVTEVSNIIESPLDSDSLQTSGNYQKYMTEIIAEGEGKTAYNAMKAMCTGGSTDWSDASQVDWFCWPKTATNWAFYSKGTDIYSQYPADGTHQQDILNEGLTQGIGACICAFGKIERKNGGEDNSVVTSVSMDDYLIISTNGNADKKVPTDEDVENACPVAEYTGNTSGGDFSPADEDTTNYIVISGKMVLNPTMKMTGTCYKALSGADSWEGDKHWHDTVPSRNNDDGRYYTRKYWKADNWNDEAALDDETNAKYWYSTFYPYTSTGPQDYEFNYSAVGVATDTLSKVGLIACMLIIGDKCVVEKQPGEKLDTDTEGTGNGAPEDFVWRKYKTRAECADDDEYFQQSFTIGIDPKLKDKILGTEFDIQKNAPYTKGITADGTAIPIHMSDHVSGQVKFYILGPVNTEWNNVTRRHPTFFRHTKWYENSVLLLQHANSIMMKGFKMEVVSDNGKIGAVSDESDIVYMSDTKETFVNKKDDLEFKITTALTSAECKQLGVNNAVKLSSPHNVNTDSALLSIYDYNIGEPAKPEQLYVDAYWKEWHEPRVVLTQNFEDGDHVSFFNLYRHPAMGKTFHVEGISRNLTEGTAEIVMKEVF